MCFPICSLYANEQQPFSFLSVVFNFFCFLLFLLYILYGHDYKYIYVNVRYTYRRKRGHRLFRFFLLFTFNLHILTKRRARFFSVVSSIIIIHNFSSKKYIFNNKSAKAAFLVKSPFMLFSWFKLT